MTDPGFIADKHFVGPAHRRGSLLSLLELTKPITWFPPFWAYGCGLVASGLSFSQLIEDRSVFILLGLVLAGPAVCGTSQVVNDWFDRHVDKINQPERPIPSGRVPGRRGLYFAILLTGLSALLGWFIGPLALAAAGVGLAAAWSYSAPPLRLKQHPVFGAGVVGLSYEGLPWITATALALDAVPDHRIFVVALLYSAGAYGIMVLNDFKAVDGDRQMGVRTLPLLYGTRTASLIACAVMALSQLLVVIGLGVWGHAAIAGAVATLLLVQCLLMVRLVRDPEALAPWYGARGVTLFVLGMLASAAALGGHLPEGTPWL